MKKLYILLSITIISFGLSAQYLNVTDVYFANNPNDMALPDTGLIPGAQLVLHFKFTNNLSNQQSLNSGDTVSFGWRTTGTSVIDTLGTRNWPAVLPNGQSATLYAHHMTSIPSDTCFTWEVCIWPLFNPYAPNLDPTIGVHCTTFKTAGCTSSSPNSIALINDKNVSNFYVVNNSLHYQFPENSKGNRIELFNILGNKVLSENVSTQGLLNMYSEISSGIYILKASNSEFEVVQKILIQ